MSLLVASRHDQGAAPLRCFRRGMGLILTLLQLLPIHGWPTSSIDWFEVADAAPAQVPGLRDGLPGPWVSTSRRGGATASRETRSWSSTISRRCWGRERGSGRTRSRRQRRAHHADRRLRATGRRVLEHLVLSNAQHLPADVEPDGSRASAFSTPRRGRDAGRVTPEQMAEAMAPARHPAAQGRRSRGRGSRCHLRPCRRREGPARDDPVPRRAVEGRGEMAVLDSPRLRFREP